jgi:nitrogen fixation protein NifB
MIPHTTHLKGTQLDLPVLGNNSASSSGGSAVARNSSCSAKSCGGAGDTASELPADVREKVYNHPCYSEDAHHHFARLHVAVAPSCNIQCNYCNRKYDCANESRPGVVSELLTPEQAVRKTLVVGAAIPQLSVLGIAGPGDPLASPERTFATFGMIDRYAPDIKLCVSTNGLMLPECMDDLARYNVSHVTITINCIDPDVGAQIYPWIRWKGRRVHGREGAAILIEQQQKGLELCVAAGILVKVNSVMIPGINDRHLKEVSRMVKAKGAFLHNVMPLISAPEHGTYFGKVGQRGPTAEELQALQDACAGDMKMMRHCRQCRADAVGFLGEDRGAEFTLEKIATTEIDLDAAAKRRAEVRAAIALELDAKRLRKARMAGEGAAPQARIVPLDAVRRAPPEALAPPVRMAVASSGSGLINQHFGHAREFLIYEASTAGVRFLGPRKTTLYCAGEENCGDAREALARSIGALDGCVAVLCSKIGFEPWGALEAAGITPNGEHAMQPIEEAVQAVYEELRLAGKLSSGSASIRHSA